MLKMRFVFLGVASALVLGTGTALANVSWNEAAPSSPSGTTVSADADAHGDAVSKAASAESHEASAEGQENKDGARAAAVAKCKAADAKEKAEPKSSQGLTKAQKKADRAEDKTERKKIVACITGHTS
jgi:hypothetical protein